MLLIIGAILFGFWNEASSNSRSEEKRKIFIFSKHLQWLNYEDMATTAKKLGFDGVDLTVRPGGHIEPEEVVDKLPVAVAAIRNEGLIINTITTAITDTDDANTEKIIKTAARLGISRLRLGWYELDEDLSMDANLELISNKMNEVNDLCARYKVRADYQNHSGDGFGASIWDIREVYKKINPDWLGIRYDVRHATVEGTYSWINDLKIIRQYIKSLDIKDYNWEETEEGLEPGNVPLGDGMVDFRQYANLLKELDIQGDITLHLEYPLGGAEHGERKLTIDPAIVLDAIKKDLLYIKKHVL
ncbi:MAG: TIM barrel protein [Bacteroidota bacterium]